MAVFFISSSNWLRTSVSDTVIAHVNRFVEFVHRLFDHFVGGNDFLVAAIIFDANRCGYPDVINGRFKWPLIDTVA